MIINVIILILGSIFWFYVGLFPWFYSKRMLFAEKFMCSTLCLLCIIGMWVILR